MLGWVAISSCRVFAVNWGVKCLAIEWTWRVRGVLVLLSDKRPLQSLLFLSVMNMAFLEGFWLTPVYDTSWPMESIFLLALSSVIQCILCFHFDLVEQGNLLVGRPVRWPGVASAAGWGGGRSTEGQKRRGQPPGGHSLNPKYVAFDRIFHSFFLPLNQVSLYFLMNHSGHLKSCVELAEYFH